MTPKLGYAVQRWSERLSDEHLAWAVRAIVAICAGGVPHSPCPPGMERAWEEIEQEQVTMLRAYNAKVRRLAEAGRKGGQRKAENWAARVRLANATTDAPEAGGVANASRAGRKNATPAHEGAPAQAPARVSEVPVSTSNTEVENLGLAENGSGSSTARARAHTREKPAPAATSHKSKILDYIQIFDLSVNAEDVAISATGEPYTEVAANTYARFARALGEVKFRQIVAKLWGEARSGEHRDSESLAAVLVSRLRAAIPPNAVR